MATLKMARSGPTINLWVVVRFNMAHSTSQHTGFNRLSAVETSKALTDWDEGDGSVMMIGGGGENCSRADHGIGITETNEASFAELRGGDTEYDFGYNAQTSNAPTHDGVVKR